MDLTRFLAACYYEPSRLFAEERLFESMQAAAGPLGADLVERARRLGAAFETADIETLLVDYTRLFLGPTSPRARPYGSHWLSGESTLMQDSTLDVLALYREGGFDLDPEIGDLPDHIAIELECLYALEFKLEAARARDDGSAGPLAALKRRLLDDHVGRWAGPFTAAMHEGAETAFYRELAGLTQAWLARLSAPETPPATSASA